MAATVFFGVIVFLASLVVSGHFQGVKPVRDLNPISWASPSGLEAAVRRDAKTRTVGMFYFLDRNVTGAPIYDITKLLQANPMKPAYGDFGRDHWWGEPWFGYYQSADPWVIRKHMQMLSNAGIDVIVFDNTNGPTYPDVYIPLFKVLEQMKQEGVKGPQVAFFTGHGAWNTVEKDVYARGLYPDLWFRWRGKPLMMVHLEEGDQLPNEIRDRFSIRESWAWASGNWFGDGHDKWTWLDNYPQAYGWHESKSTPEEVSVSVAQHATTSIGRSSSAQVEPPVDDQRLTPRTSEGVCFKQQFERALQIDPEFIFVTGWNEWTATRFKSDSPAVLAGRPEPAGGSVFVDEYNAEFSRDIEPAKGILQDAYYTMLVDFVRRYKGGAGKPVANSFRKIDLNGSPNQWTSIEPEYRDAIGDVQPRDHAGWGTERYTNATGRNDIVLAKLAYDAKNVYFYVETRHALTPASEPNWMMLYLDVPAGQGNRWLGYNFAIDRSRTVGLASVEANAGGYRWRRIGEAYLQIGGKFLVVAVPRGLVGVAFPGAKIRFKWADNILQTGEAQDFSENGDVAPDDRFNYQATLSR